jgi:hypothetical protein
MHRLQPLRLSFRVTAVTMSLAGALAFTGCDSGSDAQAPGDFRTVVPSVTASIDPARTELPQRDTSTASNGLEVTVQVFRNSDGSLTGQGEVQNTRTLPVESLDIFVTFHSESGDVLASAAVPPEPDSVPPGGKAAFSIFFPSPPEGIVNYTTQVVAD